MSFKLITPKSDFLATVQTEIPGDKGKGQKVTFSVRFKRLSMLEYEALIERINDKDKDGNRTAKDQDLIDELLTGFGDDLFDDNGNPLEFTPDNVAALCDIFPIRPAIVTAFFDGYARAKAKN
ncbi:MAG: hypothetical protein JZU64_15480 [Rhodoferax sp.]|jgi:hypothetical protein|nr:hypothetical protein [Rhodoferax sp.]